MAITFNRYLLMAKTEATFDEAETLSPANDAFEVIGPEPAPDISSQRREVGQASLSPAESFVTRRVGGLNFGVELKGNGVTPAGTTAPRIGRLLRACGFSETSVTAAGDLLFRTVAGDSNTGGAISFTSDTPYDRRVFSKIKVEITSAGGSGTAVAEVTAPAEATYATGGFAKVDMTGVNDVTLTDAAEVPVVDVDGNTVASFTPSFGGGTADLGDVYWLHFQPAGFQYLPISDGIPSLTIAITLPDESGNSIRHTITGARGTFTINAEIGGFPVINFEFTGTYIDQTDVATPTGESFESTDPAQVQFAALGFALRDDVKFTDVCANSWSIDLGGNVSPRDCINSQAATRGAIFTGREPTLSMDPEAILKAEYPVWSFLEKGLSLEWSARHGTVAGNTWAIHCPNAQITGISYSDRNNIRVFNIDGSAARLSANDEIRLCAV
mgnify:CR=1 FL=1